MQLANEFNEKMAKIEGSSENTPTAPTDTQEAPATRKPRRRRGTELTLDD